MKIFALLFCGLSLILAQDNLRNGDFDIRFEPTAKLQTRVPVPFQITVKDARHKSIGDAKVTLQIETKADVDVHVFQAPAIVPSTGTYLAKPVFPKPGTWDIYVQVERAGAMTARTLQFAVPE